MLSRQLQGLHHTLQMPIVEEANVKIVKSRCKKSQLHNLDMNEGDKEIDIHTMIIYDTL